MWIARGAAALLGAVLLAVMPTAPAAATLPPAPTSPVPRAILPTQAEFLQPAGDLDGDGRADLVATIQGDDHFVVEARQGTDGTSLWTRAFPGSAFAVVGLWSFKLPSSAGAVFPARLGADGAPGILVAQHVITAPLMIGVSPYQRDLRLVALSATGNLLWARYFPGAPDAHATVPAGCDDSGCPISASVRSPLVPGFGGLLRATASDADDVLVHVGGGFPGQLAARAIVVDGATGIDTHVPLPSSNEDTSVEPAGDLSGDGLDDFVVSTPLDDYSRLRLSAHTGQGATLWTIERAWRSFEFLDDLGPAGDIDGDGRDDLLRGFESRVLSGADGSEVLDLAGQALALEDDGGDGRDDLLVTTTSGATLTFTARDAINTRYTTSRTIAGAAAIGRKVVLAGDVDGDGVADASYYVTSPSGVFLERGVLSGASGTILWSDTTRDLLHRPSQGSVDGSGDDLYATDFSVGNDRLVITDGATGSVIWERQLGARLDNVEVADVDGDGKGEVLTDVIHSFNALTYVSAFPTVAIVGRLHDRSAQVRASGDGALLWTA